MFLKGLSTRIRNSLVALAASALMLSSCATPATITPFNTPTLDPAYEASLSQYTPTRTPTPTPVENTPISKTYEQTPVMSTPVPGQTPVMSTPVPGQTPVMPTPVMPTPLMPTPQQTPLPTPRLILEPTPSNTQESSPLETIVSETPAPTNTSIPYTGASMTQRLVKTLGDLWQLPLWKNTSINQYSTQVFDSVTYPERYLDYIGDRVFFEIPPFGYENWNGNFQHYRIVNGEYEILPGQQGPGYISRIWLRSPIQHNSVNTPGFEEDPNAVEWGLMSGNIRFYFDGEAVPSIDMPLKEFFDGNNFPFMQPLVRHYGTGNGGTVSYVPMPFKQSVRITTTELTHSFQITVKRFNQDPGYFESFRLPLNYSERSEMERIVDAWRNKGRIPYSNVSNDVRNNNYDISPGNSAELRLNNPGTIQELRVRVPKNQVSDLEMMLFWDNNPNPAVRGPLQALFGTREEIRPYQSLPMGTGITANNEVEFYNFFPMPYNNARIIIANHRGESVPVNLKVRIASPHPSGARFHANAKAERMQARTDLEGNYIAANIPGRGKFLGFVLTAYGVDRNPPVQAEQLQGYWPWPYLESNINGFVDGRMSLPGTGIEDDVNAGWYYVYQDVPGRAKTFPEAGCTWRNRFIMDEVTSQYRFYLTDAPEFNNYRMEVEHGFYYNNLSVNYSSTAFWYQY